MFPAWIYGMPALREALDTRNSHPLPGQTNRGIRPSRLLGRSLPPAGWRLRAQAWCPDAIRGAPLVRSDSDRALPLHSRANKIGGYDRRRHPAPVVASKYPLGGLFFPEPTRRPKSKKPISAPEANASPVLRAEGSPRCSRRWHRTSGKSAESRPATPSVEPSSMTRISSGRYCWVRML